MLSDVTVAKLKKGEVKSKKGGDGDAWSEVDGQATHQLAEHHL